MINKQKNFIREKAIRLLTLGCFFYFSGLNNGFTYFVISQGRMQRVDMAASLAAKLAPGLNPLAWKAAVQNAFSAQFTRSRKVIVFSSQRAVQNLLMESSLIQMWVETEVR